MEDWSSKLIEKRQVKDGLIKELSIYGFSVYVVLKAFEDTNIKITQKEVAELTGISRKKCNEVMQDLKARGLYVSQRGKEQQEDTKINARNVLTMFLEEYKKKYNETCPVNWGRDTAFIKKRIVEIYKQEDLEEIVKKAFKIYDKVGNTSQYPRLTLSAFTSFVADIAYKEILKERQNRPKQIKETKSSKDVF